MTKKITVNAPSKKITVNSTTKVVTVVAPGAQGAGFDLNLDHSDKVDNSIMYYQQSSGRVILDSNVTTSKLVDGGNF